MLKKKCVCNTQYTGTKHANVHRLANVYVTFKQRAAHFAAVLMVLNFSEAAHFQISSRQNIAIGGEGGWDYCCEVPCLAETTLVSADPLRSLLCCG